jgi:hypothetical protein
VAAGGKGGAKGGEGAGTEDEQGVRGVELSKELMSVAGEWVAASNQSD